MLLCALPAGADARPERRLTVGDGGLLRPGMVVRVSWDALPPATEEFELLLKLERPARVKLRLTESQDPSRTSLAWRVPDLPCAGARLVLRRGEAGRETTWAASEPLSIVTLGRADRYRNVARVELRAGELWLTRSAARPLAQVEPRGRPAADAPAPEAPAGGLVSTDGPASAESDCPPRTGAHRTRISLRRTDRAALRAPLRIQLRI